MFLSGFYLPYIYYFNASDTQYEIEGRFYTL